MGIGRLHATQLDRLVAEVDARGGLGTPDATAHLADFQLDFDTRPDGTLDPFSDGYFAQQQALYEELAGRPLDQTTGELTPLDVDAHAAGCNPYNSPDVRFISKHARAVLTAVMLADLPPGASVLDAGSGWGLSSEVMAFSGAKVTAVDINPRFTEVVRRRAGRLGLPVRAVASGFDQFDTAERFDLVFFYESLHHSLRPWETLARLGRFVRADGKVVLAGEPVNAFWWPHWGLRLDPASVYCVRKFGWWESGWTAEFISACFARCGFRLELHPNVGLDNGLIGVAVRANEVGRVTVDTGVLAPVRAAEAQLAAAEARYDAAAIEATALREEVRMLRRSKSWRLTAPLRSLFRALGLSG
jgi:SAM-dependent methyltransferase